jgi:hypothetical protein
MVPAETRKGGQEKGVTADMDNLAAPWGVGYGEYPSAEEPTEANYLLWGVCGVASVITVVVLVGMLLSDKKNIGPEW